MRSLWWIPSGLVVLLVGVVPLLAWLGLLGPEAFFPFLFGLLLSAFFTMTLSAAAAVASAMGQPWRGTAVRAAAIPMIVTAIAVGAQVVGGGAGHPIHDVTTDPNDGLQFTPDVATLELAVPESRERVLKLQAENYPDLASLYLGAAPVEVFAQALDVAENLPRWTLEQAFPERGRIEATARSRVFGFIDDMVIEVRLEGSGSRVEMRSRSRMGQSDLGVNAARVRAFQSALAARF